MNGKTLEMEMTYGWVGFGRTCLLFLFAHFIDLLTFQNLAYVATAFSGIVNGYYLIKKNTKK